MGSWFRDILIWKELYRVGLKNRMQELLNSIRSFVINGMNM